MKQKCRKIKLDKIKAMLIVAKSVRKIKNHNRREIGIYFCKECKCYHTTSKK